MLKIIAAVTVRERKKITLSFAFFAWTFQAEILKIHLKKI